MMPIQIMQRLPLLLLYAASELLHVCRQTLIFLEHRDGATPSHISRQL